MLRLFKWNVSESDVSVSNVSAVIYFWIYFNNPLSKRFFAKEQQFRKIILKMCNRCGIHKKNKKCTNTS
jgi:hypothetical protein